MGHAYASTFQKYMNQRVQSHVQAAFLGFPSEDALMNILSHQSRYVDPRAPSHFDDLTITERSSILTHPDLIRLQELRDSLAAEAKELYGSSKNAAGTKLGELKAKAEASLRCAKAKLKKATFNAARNQFFDTIDTKEINKKSHFWILMTKIITLKSLFTYGGTKACCRLDENPHQRPFGKRGFATPNNTDECAHRPRSLREGTVGETKR